MLYNYITIILQLYYNYITIILQLYYNYITIILQLYYNYITIILQCTMHTQKSHKPKLTQFAPTLLLSTTKHQVLDLLLQLLGWLSGSVIQHRRSQAILHVFYKVVLLTTVLYILTSAG